MFQDTPEGRIKIASMFAGCFGTLASIHDYEGNSKLETFLHSYGQDVCLPFAIYSALRFVGLKQDFEKAFNFTRTLENVSKTIKNVEENWINQSNPNDLENSLIIQKK